MVELAQTYQIRDWIGPALMALFLMSFQDFSDEQLHQLDVVVLGMLGKVQATLVSQCKYIAAVPPDVGLPGDDCRLHDLCWKVWVDVWCKRISRKLLHPTSPLSISKVVERVIKLNHSRPVNGMSISCKNNVILA